MSIHRFWLAAVIAAILAVVPSAARADDSDLDAKVDQHIALLSGRNFVDRQRAITELVEADVAAVTPVAEAAETGEPELVKSCVAILKRIQVSGSDEGRKAAETALKELAESKLPQVANAAAAALKEEADFGPGRLPANRRLLPQNIGGAGGVRISMRTVNGQRTINVKEADREIEIQDADGKKIRMSVQQVVNGKPETKEYEADDLEDLKKKNAEAAALYEKYGKQNFIQVQFQPFPGPVMNRIPRAAAPAVNEKIEAALKKLETVREKLAELKDRKEVDPAAIESLLDELKLAEKDLFAAQGALGR